jgi:hypothetical protein
MVDKPKSKGLLHIAKRSKMMMPLYNYTGVVAWTGDDHFCLYDSMGTQINCWSLEDLIVGGLTKENTSVFNKTEAEHVLKIIIEKLHEIEEKYHKGKD